MEVLVLATMSAGKSTFINALIGQELLHSANEATTACLTTVEHELGASFFRGVAYDKEKNKLYHRKRASAKIVANWNSHSDVESIKLTGHFKIRPDIESGLILHDTPGPNNSQNEHHAEQMLNAVRTISFSALFYVLNATQLGTYDDRIFLTQLRQELRARAKSNLPIYFILNKVDQLDAEAGEYVADYVKSAELYLIELGFDRPLIIPTMSNIALCAHKALNNAILTRR